MLARLYPLSTYILKHVTLEVQYFWSVGKTIEKIWKKLPLGPSFFNLKWMSNNQWDTSEMKIKLDENPENQGKRNEWPRSRHMVIFTTWCRSCLSLLSSRSPLMTHCPVLMDGFKWNLEGDGVKNPLPAATSAKKPNLAADLFKANLFWLFCSSVCQQSTWFAGFLLQSLKSSQNWNHFYCAGSCGLQVWDMERG